MLTWPRHEIIPCDQVPAPGRFSSQTSTLGGSKGQQGRSMSADPKSGVSAWLRRGARGRARPRSGRAWGGAPPP
eukprot:804587-Pleurochrysis_carterae.AAC.1